MPEEVEGAEALSSDEVSKSWIPILPSKRFYSFYDQLSIVSADGLATWLFMAGCWTGMIAPSVILGLVAMIIGCVLPLTFLALWERYHTRWGLDKMRALIATFGPRGSKLVYLLLIFPIVWAWMCIPTVMFGKAVHGVAATWAMTGWYTHESLWALLLLGLGTWLCLKGPIAIKNLMRVATPIMIALVVLIIGRMLLFYGWDNVMALRPEGIFSNPWLNFTLAIEINMGIGFSWIMNSSQFSRFGKAESHGYWSFVTGYGWVFALLGFSGVVAGAAAAAGDPVEVMIIIGGGWALVYLILLAAANFSSVPITYWFSAIGFRNLFTKWSWNKAVLINVPPTVLLILLPVVYNAFGNFVTLEASIYACLGVVWLVDILLRKYNLNLKEVYDSSSKGAYYYWKGFNPLPWIAILSGMAFSLAIYNPLTMAVHLPGIFGVTGAALCSGIFSGLIYYALAKTITMPRGKGFPEIPQPSRILTREEMQGLE